MYEANPGFNLFKQNYSKEKSIILRVFKSDLDTPVSAYLKLVKY